MDIQETISKLQSDIKRNAGYITWLEDHKVNTIHFGSAILTH